MASVSLLTRTPHPSGSRRRGFRSRNAPGPLAEARPQKTVETLAGPWDAMTGPRALRGGPPKGAQASGASVKTPDLKPVSKKEDGTAAHQTRGFKPNPIGWLAAPACSVNSRSCEGPVGFEGDLVAHPVLTGPSELVRHRLECHQAIGSSFLPLVERFDVRVITNREMGRLDKGPGQVSIAVLDMTGAFFLTVAQMLAVHTATLRGQRPHSGQAPNITGFQHEGQRQEGAHPGHGQQCLERGLELGLGLDRALQQLNLLGKAVHDHSVAFDCQRPLGVRQPLVHRDLGQVLEAMAAQTHTGGAQNEILDTEPRARSVANPLTVLAEPIPNRAFFLGVDRPLRAQSLRRRPYARHRASKRSSVYFSPVSGWIAAGLAQCSRYPAACKPSTSQYPLDVDSTTIPSMNG